LANISSSFAYVPILFMLLCCRYRG